VIDLKAARQDPGRYRTALARRGAAADFDALLAADTAWRELTERAEALRADQKRASRAGPPTDEQHAELRRLADELASAQAKQAHAERERQTLLDRIPNLPDPTAADGMAEEDAEVVRVHGEPPVFAFTPKDAADLGSKRGWIDMRRGARLSGSRFAYRIGDVAQAELALYRFVLDKLAGHGFLPVLPPVLVGEQAMYGTGFLPTEESNLYHLEKDDLYLTGTSEVALAGIHMEERLEENDLPALYMGYSTNFRREAGAADLGAPAAKKFDIEGWFPTQQRYRELTSCSNTTDYQARRLNIRFRRDGNLEFVHTLNGTGATARSLLAIMENFQDEGGRVTVPEVLTRYGAPATLGGADD
jgi:seryl-tRNA synthetase